MTPTRLISELAARIKEVTAQIRLPLETGEPVEVEVFAQYLPEDLFENTAYLPFCLIELLNIKDDFKDGSEAQVGLTAGIYAREVDAWKDSFHLMEVIRQDLLKRRLIGRRFRLTGAQWELPDTQPREFFFATGILTFDFYQVQEVIR